MSILVSYNAPVILKSKRPEYKVWAGMKTRCFNTRDWLYPAWGGRGITMAPEWVHDFEKFFAYVGPRPPGITPGGRAVYSIDRIDNDGNYEPGNVRWATQSQQARNQRKHMNRGRRVG